MRPTLARRPALLAVLAVLAALVVPLSAGPADANHTPTPSRVTLMGSLMSELGCQATGTKVAPRPT